MRRRTLALRRETLTELATNDLTAVVGGVGVITERLTTCVVSLALGICNPSVNPKCPGAEA